MEITDIAKSLLSAENLKALSKSTGAAQKDIKSVLVSALPLLLSGKSAGESAEKAAEESGVSGSKAQKILSAALPLLKKLLGKSSGKDDELDLGDLVGTVLSNVDVGDVLSGLLGGDDDKDEKKDKKDKKDDGLDLGDVAGLLGSLLK